MSLTKCCICGSEEYKYIYKGVIRDGAFGSETAIDHEVVKCVECGLVRLKENPVDLEFYQSEEYRKTYDDAVKPSQYIEKHDPEQLPRLNKIGVETIRRKVVLDYGCGGGAFLDLVNGLAQETIGIEPFGGYHDSLEERNHVVFPDSASARVQYNGKVDKIVSFFVIEHVEDPVSFLSDAYQLLKQGGSMYLETNNLDDLLINAKSKVYERFFYRTAHLWYFDSGTLIRAAEKAGFRHASISYRHNYDLSNAFLWLRDEEPTGNGKLDLFDKRINASWKTFVEEAGIADTICIEMTK